jgi:alkyl hydroperoxide reductase subunit D
MDFLNELKSRIPDYAKDIRLNLESVISRSSLTPAQAIGAALAAAFATRSADLVAGFRRAEELPSGHADAALTAAALMGMNNIWYPYVEMAADDELKTVRAELRMNAYANHGGVDRVTFELYALAASIVGKCHFCVASHYKLLRESGLTVQQLRDVGRIAAVVNAASQVLAVQSGPVAA